uniref:Uncharacterized protein n=1 Tax=Arundo donax TaxID=35708 RepID=A0A0A8ZVS4_ARUDO
MHEEDIHMEHSRFANKINEKSCSIKILCKKILEEGHVSQPHELHWPINSDEPCLRAMTTKNGSKIEKLLPLLCSIIISLHDPTDTIISAKNMYLLSNHKS